jgi:hypothetical protein
MRKKRALRHFRQSVADLQELLRDLHSLSDTEQLLIENRLMILQFEYTRWLKRQALQCGTIEMSSPPPSEKPTYQ